MKKSGQSATPKAVDPHAKDQQIGKVLMGGIAAGMLYVLANKLF